MTARTRFFHACLFIAVGTLLLLWTLGIVGRVVDLVAVLWPVLLIGIGAWLILGRVSVADPTTVDGREIVTVG